MSVLGAELDQENAAYMIVASAGMFGWCLWATLMFFEFPVWASVLIELVMFIGSFAFMIRRWNKQVRAEEEAERVAYEARIAAAKAAKGEKPAAPEAKKDK